MAQEIERKFLVTDDRWRTGSGTLYRQGYLNTDKQRTVRVRISDDSAFLSVKGLTHGATREEFEYSIPVADAEAMLQLCQEPLIEKRRFLCGYQGMVWEIDEFAGVNEGLVIAEIELDSEDQPFDRPPWLGNEVTHDPRYYNANLVALPFRDW